MTTGTVNQIENEIRVWSFQNFGNGIALGVSRFAGKLYPKAYFISSQIKIM